MASGEVEEKLRRFDRFDFMVREYRTFSLSYLPSLSLSLSLSLQFFFQLFLNGWATERQDFFFLNLLKVSRLIFSFFFLSKIIQLVSVSSSAWPQLNEDAKQAFYESKRSFYTTVFHFKKSPACSAASQKGFARLTRDRTFLHQVRYLNKKSCFEFSSAWLKSKLFFPIERKLRDWNWKVFLTDSLQTTNQALVGNLLKCVQSNLASSQPLKIRTKRISNQSCLRRAATTIAHVVATVATGLEVTGLRLAVLA